MIQCQHPVDASVLPMHSTSKNRHSTRQTATELLLIANRLSRLHRRRYLIVRDRQQLRALRTELRSLLRGHDAC